MEWRPHPKSSKFIASHREVLDLFDKNVAGARAALAGIDDESLAKPWSLLSGGKTIFHASAPVRL
jgi:hypothetical protein